MLVQSIVTFLLFSKTARSSKYCKRHSHLGFMKIYSIKNYLNKQYLQENLRNEAVVLRKLPSQ